MPDEIIAELHIDDGQGGPVVESWPPVEDPLPDPSPSPEDPAPPRATADTIRPGDTIVTRVMHTVASVSTDVAGITITFDDDTTVGPYQPGDAVEVG